MKEGMLLYRECDYCEMREVCGGYRSEEDCAGFLEEMIDACREEFAAAWRIYISEYED